MNDTAKSDTKVITPPFRMAFPQLLAPKAFSEGQKERYSMIAIFAPTDFNKNDLAAWKNLTRALNEISTTKFGKPLKALQGNVRKPIHNSQDKSHLAGFVEGTVYANLTSLYKPGLVDSSGIEIIDGEGEVYAGRWARATVSPYSYSNAYGKGIMLGLRNVQLLKHDERLDGRTDGAEDFKDTSIDEKYLDQGGDTNDSVDSDATDDFDDDLGL